MQFTRDNVEEEMIQLASGLRTRIPLEQLDEPTEYAWRQRAWYEYQKKYGRQLVLDAHLGGVRKWLVLAMISVPAFMYYLQQELHCLDGYVALWAICLELVLIRAWGISRQTCCSLHYLKAVKEAPKEWTM